MTVVALGLYRAFLAVALGWRTWLQYRRTGDHGFRGLSGKVGSLEWCGGVSLILGMALGLASLVAQAADIVEPIRMLARPAIRTAGLGLVLAGFAVTITAQVQMRDSWRIGVDEREKTGLVTEGLFAFVRNPIFTGMLLAATGILLPAPNLLSALALASALTGLEIRPLCRLCPKGRPVRAVDRTVEGADDLASCRPARYPPAAPSNERQRPSRHRRSTTMWSRRRFLENISAWPLVGGFAAAGAGTAAAAPGRSGRRDYFRDLGVRPFINAAGTYTAMTASLMPPEVMDAIHYASKHYVMLDELHDRVGQRIAEMVHAEAAMVTSGAASALTLGTAAVLTGTDRQKIVDLPNLGGMKSEVIIQKSHRFGYDHAVRNCGVRLVEVETPEELEQAVTDKTAMMLFYNNNNKVGRIPDEQFVQLGKKHGVPTFNDAAADVPPVDNLWKYTKMGFDLVTFSGGKGIRGPQSAGLLLGRKDLIEAARLNAPPNSNTVGRGMKVNKEELLGMLVALELYLEKDHARESREFDKRAEAVRSGAAAVPGVKAEVFVPEVANHVPHVRISWDGADEAAAAAAVKAMKDGEPSIGIRNEGNALVIGVWMMRPGEEKIVARRLRQVLEKKA